MQSKLTLRLDEDLIKFAKQYAKKTGQPVSKVVANYFSVLQDKDKQKQDKQKQHILLPPLVSSLHASLKSSKHTEKDYKKYLEDKYL